MLKYKIKKAVSLLGLTLLVASSMTPVQSGPREDNAKVMFPKVRADLAASGPLSDSEAVCVVGLAYAGNGARRHDPKVWDECLVARFTGPVQPPVQQQKLLTAPEPQKLLEGGEPQKLLTAPDPKGLLTAPDQKKRLTGPEARVVSEATNEVVPPSEGPVFTKTFKARVPSGTTQTRTATTGEVDVMGPHLEMGDVISSTKGQVNLNAPHLEMGDVTETTIVKLSKRDVDQVKDAQGALDYVRKVRDAYRAGEFPNKSADLEVLDLAHEKVLHGYRTLNNAYAVKAAQEAYHSLMGLEGVAKEGPVAGNPIVRLPEMMNPLKEGRPIQGAVEEFPVMQLVEEFEPMILQENMTESNEFFDALISKLPSDQQSGAQQGLKDAKDALRQGDRSAFENYVIDHLQQVEDEKNNPGVVCRAMNSARDAGNAVVTCFKWLTSPFYG